MGAIAASPRRSAHNPFLQALRLFSAVLLVPLMTRRQHIVEWEHAHRGVVARDVSHQLRPQRRRVARRVPRGCGTVALAGWAELLRPQTREEVAQLPIAALQRGVLLGGRCARRPPRKVLRRRLLKDGRLAAAARRVLLQRRKEVLQLGAMLTVLLPTTAVSPRPDRLAIV
eukprot:4501808-Prymnesium_polylepis.1